MYIKTSRLCMIIMASVFLGLSIGLYIINAVDPAGSTVIPAICIVGMLILMLSLFVVQHFNNRATKKAEREKEPVDKTNN